MPTRENQTTITIADEVRKILNTYREPGESWDQFFIELMKWVEDRLE